MSVEPEKDNRQAGKTQAADRMRKQGRTRCPSPEKKDEPRLAVGETGAWPQFYPRVLWRPAASLHITAGVATLRAFWTDRRGRHHSSLVDSPSIVMR
jgi:hypothetical protein